MVNKLEEGDEEGQKRPENFDWRCIVCQRVKAAPIRKSACQNSEQTVEGLGRFKNLWTGSDSIRVCFIRGDKVINGFQDISVNNFGETSSEHLEGRFCTEQRIKGEQKKKKKKRGTEPVASFNHLEGDIFSFSIAIKPQDEPLASSWFRLEGLKDVFVVIRNKFGNRQMKKICRVASFPVSSIRRIEIILHQVTRNGSEHHGTLLPSNFARELVDGVVFAFSFSLCDVAFPKKCRDLFGNRRLFSWKGVRKESSLKHPKKTNPHSKPELVASAAPTENGRQKSGNSQ